MSTNYNDCTEGCSMPSDTNEIKIMIKQLNKKVQDFYNDTNESLLEHDHKIAEMCNYLKLNLGDSLRTLIDTMIANGEIDEVLRRVLLFNDPISVKDFRSNWRWCL